MFFPLKDLNPTRRFPIVTLLLIAANIVVFVYELSLGSELHTFVASFGAIPYEITRATDLVGPVSGTPIIHEKGPIIPYMTLVTSMFIHGGVMHILGNMLYLWIFGNNIEDILGPIKFLIFYLVTGVIAALAHVFTQPSSMIPTVGASGAVSGILGAYLVVFPRARVLTLIFLGIFFRIMLLPAWVLLVFWFVIQALAGVLSLSRGLHSGAGVAWFAHIGGFIAGVILIRLMWRRHSEWGRTQDSDAY